MLKNKSLMFATILAIPLSSKEIVQTGIGIGESKSVACQNGLENAQKEALYQSGINIFSVYEKTEISTNEVKQIINYNLQSSFGFVKTRSKTEQTSFDDKTGNITCNVIGTFDVDTSKLQTQLSALSKKYNNINHEENERSNKLNEKNELIAKYENLKTKMETDQSFYFSDSYRCGENLNVVQCKTELQNKLKNSFKEKLAEKYDIESSFITIKDIKLDNEIDVSVKGMLVATYSGKIKSSVLSIKNPYLDEINSLNAYLGERQIFENEKDDNSPSWYNGLGTSIWNGTKNVFGFPFRKGNRIVLNRYWTEATIFDEDRDTEYATFDYLTTTWECEDWVNCKIDESFSHIDYYIRIFDSYFIKYGNGTAYVKDIKEDYNSIYDNQEGFINDYSYRFHLIGLSMSFGPSFGRSFEQMLTFGVDYVMPYNEDGYTEQLFYHKRSYNYEVLMEKKDFKGKSFFNYYATFDLVVDHFIAGIGITISEDEIWSFNWFNYHIGLMF